MTIEVDNRYSGMYSSDSLGLLGEYHYLRLDSSIYVALPVGAYELPGVVRISTVKKIQLWEQYDSTLNDNVHIEQRVISTHLVEIINKDMVNLYKFKVYKIREY